MLRMVVGLLAGAGVLLASTVSSAQSKPNSASTKPTVLVFPFAALGDESRATAEMLRRNLIVAINALGEVSAIDPAVAEKTLGRPLADARDACAEDKPCTAALGSAVGARYLVIGGLSTNGDTSLLSFQLFDVAAAEITKVPKSPSVVNSASAEQEMKRAAAWLFATTGLLTVKCNVDGADVFVDSKPIGRTNLVRAVQVPAGKINLRVEKPGFDVWTGAIDIAPGAQQSIPVDLVAKSRPIAGPKPTPRPPATTTMVKRPVFWAAVGGVALALGAGAAVAANQGSGKSGSTEEVQNDPTFTFGFQGD